MKLTPQIIAAADRRVALTLDEAKRLPDLLGRICPAMLRAHGFYTCTSPAGVKTLYVLAKEN